MRSALAMAIGLAGAFATAAPSSSVLGWDVTATYDFGDDTGPVDFSLEGVYSHVIECPSSWAETSSSTGSTPSQDHVVRYAWSYTQGEIRFEEELEGTIMTTVHDCPDADLGLRGGGAGWNGVEVRYPNGADPCTVLLDDGVRTAGTPNHDFWEGASSLQLGTRMCVVMAGSTLSTSAVPFTGLLDGYTVRRHDGAYMLEGNTCAMVVGSCWPGTGEWGAAYNNGALCTDTSCVMDTRCDAHPPFAGIGRPVGIWKCEVWRG